MKEGLEGQRRWDFLTVLLLILWLTSTGTKQHSALIPGTWIWLGEVSEVIFFLNYYCYYS